MITKPGTACPVCDNLVTCTCDIQREHEGDCRFMRAARLGIEIACPHGYQACPECDPCTCNPPRKTVGVR